MDNYFSSVDRAYVSGIANILNNGVYKPDRTSVGGNYSVFGMSFKLPVQKLTNGYTMPFLQIRRYAPRIAFWELIWMLNGRVDNQFLTDRDIHIWDGNTSEEYLKKAVKEHIEPGTIGKGYGWQFRNSNGVDQLQNVYDSLKSNPVGRRHVIELWNPADIQDMALEPCHHTYEFYFADGRLSLHQHMRSWDYIFGAPYNIGFAAMFLAFMANALGYETGNVWYTGTDVHIYENQLSLANKVLECRMPDTQPIIEFPELNSLQDILDLQWTDISLTGFERGPQLEKVDMAV